MNILLRTMTNILNPFISIIVPTFNRAVLIKETLLSIESQTHKNFECILVDDGSTDNTIGVAQEFINRDIRFKIVLNNRKKGAQGARNTGLLNAKGEFIYFFDSDNLMHTELLAKQIEYFADNPLCDVCTCYSHLLNDENEITGAFIWITKGNILKDILKGSTYVDYNSSMIKKSVIDKMGLLDEDCPSFQEWDTHIRLAVLANYGTVHELLVSYYQRSTGRISSCTKRELYGLTYIYAKHKKLWIDVVGECVFFPMIYSLGSRISKEDKSFQKEMSILLPDLKKPLLKFKVINLYRKLLLLLK